MDDIWNFTVATFLIIVAIFIVIIWIHRNELTRNRLIATILLLMLFIGTLWYMTGDTVDLEKFIKDTLYLALLFVPLFILAWVIAK